MLLLQSILIDAEWSSPLFRQAHQLHDRQSWQLHLAGHILSGSPPLVLPGPTPPAWCLGRAWVMQSVARFISSIRGTIGTTIVFAGIGPKAQSWHRRNLRAWNREALFCEDAQSI